MKQFFRSSLLMFFGLVFFLQAMANCPVVEAIKYSSANTRYEGLDENGHLWIFNSPDLSTNISKFRYAVGSNTDQTDTVTWMFCSYVLGDGTILTLQPSIAANFDIIETGSKWKPSRSYFGSYFTCVSADTKDCPFVPE